MKDIAIKVENLSKRYRIGLKEETKDTFVGALSSLIKSPFQNLKRINKLTSFNENKNESDDIIWALKDISFEVKRGEVLGIIGANGAGKSTLLKILAQITYPTSGRVKLYGRVASLLEVGTGFHPELTGRNNIYLNGTILGMTKKEIDQKFDEIVDFSGIKKFIDTPVKRYSSGMGVRLAFSVAAHLDPEILLIDEVLAVGDADFQKKCLGKMGEVAKGGRTVLFVSHNMTAIKSLCNTVLSMNGGCIIDYGDAFTQVEKYLSFQVKDERYKSWKIKDAPGIEYFKVKRIFIDEKKSITTKMPFKIFVEFWVLTKKLDLNVSMVVYDLSNNPIYNISTDNVTICKGIGKVIFDIPADFMNDGKYYITNHFVSNSKGVFIHENALSFEIFDDRDGLWHGKWIGAVRPNFIKREIGQVNENN